MGLVALTFSILTGFFLIHSRKMSITKDLGASVLIEPGVACERETLYLAFNSAELVERV